MAFIKKYFPVLLIVVPVIIAVLLRSTVSGHFRYDAERWAEPSVGGANLISSERMTELKGDAIVLNLDYKPGDQPQSSNHLVLPADSVLSKTMIRKLGRYNGPVVILSGDPALAARIWMALSQTGIKDLYILTDDSLNESLKEKFRTDTLISPEL